jgi:hypothetical protein
MIRIAVDAFVAFEAPAGAHWRYLPWLLRPITGRALMHAQSQHTRRDRTPRVRQARRRTTAVRRAEKHAGTHGDTPRSDHDEWKEHTMPSTLTDQPTRIQVRILPVAALAIGLALPWGAPATADGPPAHETADVLTFAGFEPVEDATARLARGDDTLFTRTDTRDLDHRHVMTLWWVIFNHPEHCEHGQGDLSCGEGDLFDGPNGPTGVEPACVFADGSLVGGNGHARFSDRLAVGEARDSCIDFFVDAVDGLEGVDHGLTNPAGAEVHLVVRSHGPRIPGEVAEQRSTFAGGCEVLLDVGATHELAPGECSDLQFAVFPAGD